MLYYPVATEHLGPPVLGALRPWGSRVLWTAYPFVQGIKPLSLLVHFLREFDGSPMIADSGIYTLVNLLGDALTDDVLLDYTRRYVDLLRTVGYKGPRVEMDVHFIQRDPNTLKRCREIFEPVHDQTIFVFRSSMEDVGVFAQMVKDHKRIGVSFREANMQPGDVTFGGAVVPDLEYRRNVKSPAQLVRRIVAAGGSEVYNRHVHILGSTEAWMATFPDNFSCDSASWSAFMFWGGTLTGTPWEVTLKGGRFRAVDAVMREVLRHTPAMIRAYKASPEYSGKPVRVKYTQMLAAGLRSSLLWWQSLRNKYRGEGDGPFDPAEFRGSHGEETYQEEVPLPRKRKREYGHQAAR